MGSPKYGANTIEITHARYLIVDGGRSHLASVAGPEHQGRPALAAKRFEQGGGWSDWYDLDAIREPIWNPRTLCGRWWDEMRPGLDPGFNWRSDSALAPDCKTCLRIIGNQLVSTPPDERIPMIAEMVAEQVMAIGMSTVAGVPGDQSDRLRKAIRLRLRKLGVRGRTYAALGSVHIVSDEIWESLSRAITDNLDRDPVKTRSDSRRGLARPRLRLHHLGEVGCRLEGRRRSLDLCA